MTGDIDRQGKNFFPCSQCHSTEEREGYIMKRVCCIVQYSKINARMEHDSVHYSYYEIDRLSVITRNGHKIDLTNHHIRFPDHDSMLRNVLMVLKNNNYYVGTYKNFGVTWYEIEWINSDAKGNCERWSL